MDPKLVSLLDRLLLPALMLICGVILLVTETQEQIALMLLAMAIGIPLPQKASGLLGKKQ